MAGRAEPDTSFESSWATLPSLFPKESRLGWADGSFDHESKILYTGNLNFWGSIRYLRLISAIFPQIDGRAQLKEDVYFPFFSVLEHTTQTSL